MQVLLLPMLKPRSYTREDVVELHCHGGSVCVQRVLSLCLVRVRWLHLQARAVASQPRNLQRAGARLASPGEFTMRSFMNGAHDMLCVCTWLQAEPGAFCRAFGPTSGAAAVSLCVACTADARVLLAQAESVQAIIDAQTKEAADSALLALRGAENKGCIASSRVTLTSAQAA